MFNKTEQVKVKKIHWSLRLGMFCLSVLTLSWFFAGWRQIHEIGGLTDWALLFTGIISTLLLLAVQGYWIYFEEKSKGTLKKNIAIFEKINQKLKTRGVESNE